MKLALPIALAAALAAGAWLPAVHAQDSAPKEPSLLDNALDGNSAEPAKHDPAKPGGQPAKPPAPLPPAIDPNAAKTVDDDDLTKKLTGETPETSGPEQMLDEVVQRMTDSAKRLKEKDPGAVTQETQRRIVMNLDALIDLVKQQQQQQQQQQSQSRPGQQRQQNQQNNGNQSGAQHSPGGTNAAQQSQLPGASDASVSANTTDINEKSREWGNLPERDRDLVVNGQKEDPLPAYREAVQRYYKALADVNKGGQNNR